MSLTLGIGPLSRRQEAGQLNATIDGPARLLWFHAVPQRVRAWFGDEVVLDTEAAHLLHETRLLPVYYVPRRDVRFDLLEPSDHRTTCPIKGEARYWSIRVGDHVAQDAVWGYDEPVAGAPDLAPYVAFYFDRLDRWCDEDEEVIGHPRDPFHRVDVRPSRRTVTVRVDGEQVASADHAMVLFETGLPPRWYLSPDAFAPGVLVDSEHRSVCPYKGRASYRSIRTSSGSVVPDVVWSYAEPFDEARRIAGLVCVDQGHDRIEVDVSPGAGSDATPRGGVR